MVYIKIGSDWIVYEEFENTFVTVTMILSGLKSEPKSNSDPAGCAFLVQVCFLASDLRRELSVTFVPPT